MEIFVIIEFIPVDDNYYGYKQLTHSFYDTFEKAKEKVEEMINNSGKWAKKYCGYKGFPFIEIVKMKMGETEKEIIYSTMKELE